MRIDQNASQIKSVDDKHVDLDKKANRKILKVLEKVEKNYEKMQVEFLKTSSHMTGIDRLNAFNNTRHDKLTKNTQIVIDDMKETVNKMRIDFHDRVTMIDEDFSKS